MIFSCSSDIWTTIRCVFKAVSIAAFAELIIDSWSFSWRDSEIVFCFCKSSCSTSCTTSCSEFSSVISSKFSESDKYVRSRDTSFKPLTRPFLGFVINPKSSRLSRLSASKSSKSSVSSSFKDASSSIGKLIEVSSPISGNKSCKESNPSSSSSKPTGSSETSSFFCKSSRLVT